MINIILLRKIHTRNERNFIVKRTSKTQKTASKVTFVALTGWATVFRRDLIGIQDTNLLHSRREENAIGFGYWLMVGDLVVSFLFLLLYLQSSQREKSKSVTTQSQIGHHKLHFDLMLTRRRRDERECCGKKHHK